MGKADLYPDFREFLKSLNSAKVRYLLIGGYAVAFYGHRRHTDDIDIWIAVEDENLQKVSKVLQEFGGFSPSQVSTGVLKQPGKVFAFGREPVRIDILTGPSGVDFEKCWPRRRQDELDGVRVSIIGFEDLKANKRASGRTKDLADLENLPPKPPPKRQRRRSQ